MSNTEVTRDHPPLPLAPVDTSVKIPDSVKKAAALAESYYSKAPPPKPGEQEPAPPARVAPVDPERAPLPAAAEPETRPQPVTAEPDTRPQPVAAEPQAQPDTDHKDVNEEGWQHRYLSMQGRFQASQRTIGSMQEQMQQLGDELVRTQQLIENKTQKTRVPDTAKTFITPEDEAAYGPELIDLATRAARQAITPELETLRQQNDQLQQRVTTQAKQDMFAALDRDEPTWRKINRSQRFISWLRLPDVYSRRVRQSMLDDAYQAADAPTVAEFFKGFLRDETATGNAEPAPQPEPQSAPRTAAVPLASLAAPGRARPATGDTPGPADKPSLPRVQIHRFYTDVRRGVFAGRDVEKARQENEIFAAQREGRVRG